MLSLTKYGSLLYGLLLLTGILATDESRFVNRSVFAEWAAVEDEMLRTLAAGIAIDESVATLAGLRKVMQREGALKGSNQGVAIVWWQGAVSAVFPAHPLVRYLPSFIGELLLAPSAGAYAIHLRLAPRCAPEGADGSMCAIRWERSRFPGSLFGLSPGIVHEEALRRLSLDADDIRCIENATWIENDPEILIRRACEVSAESGWSLMWQEDGEFRVTNVSASRKP